MSSHPFTICSLPSRDPKQPSELTFYIRHQGGFTAKLYQHALDKTGIPVGVLVDGPYGGIDLQRYYDAEHLLVVAGGSGAGWILPFIELFLRQRSVSVDEEYGREKDIDVEKEQTIPKTHRAQRSSGPFSLRVILATRDTSSRIWFERTVGDLLARYTNVRSASDIRVQVCLTGEAEKAADLPSKVPGEPTITNVSGSSSENITVKEEGHEVSVPGKEVHGRPHLPLIIQEEAERVAEGGQSLSVYVCGPETMQNDVRNAVARENLKIVKGSKSGGVYLHSEHFSWA